MHKRGGRGLTLIELMITIALLAIVIAIGVPSFQSAINGSRLSSAANELSAALQLARAEAVRRNRTVVLCRSANLSSCADDAQWNGWLMFVDMNGDGVVDAGDEIIKSGTIDAPLVLRASPGISSRAQSVTFMPNGIARGADETALLNATLSVCVPFTQPPANVREIQLAFGSRTSVRSRDSGGACNAAPSDT